MQAQGERSWGRWELLSRSLSGVKVLWCKHCDNSLNWPVQLGSRSFAVLEAAMDFVLPFASGAKRLQDTGSVLLRSGVLG